KASWSVASATRRFDDAATEVACEQPAAVSIEKLSLREKHGDGVSLLACGAAGAPDADRVIPPGEFRKQLIGEDTELTFFAEEIGLVDGDGIEERFELGLVDSGFVFGKGDGAAKTQTLLQAALQQKT